MGNCNYCHCASGCCACTLRMAYCRRCKKFIRSHRRRKDTDSLVKEVQALNKEVMRLNLEKDKILSMKVSQIGLNPNEIAELTGEEIESLNNGEEEDTGESRFYKLTEIDQLWADYVPPVYDNDITLPEFCERFRLFACSQLGLYYDIKLIRLFVASFASTRLIILQGISGTGKTSLAYAFGKFVNNPSIVASVQPSWRDRTELFGYFNEFTKKFNETELLRAMYEASYNDNIYAVILDEMNIARVEYYFAEMLSILEMPSRDEWVVDIIPNSWPSDPKHIVNGQLRIPPNMWYIVLPITMTRPLPLPIRFTTVLCRLTLTQRVFLLTHLSQILFTFHTNILSTSSMPLRFNLLFPKKTSRRLLSLTIMLLSISV